MIEIECRLTPSLGLECFVRWRLTGWAREEHQRRCADGSALRTDLELELREPRLIAWLRAGQIPAGMSWADCVRVLRGAAEWLDMAAHGGGPPQERELAVHAAGDSKWEWTEPRRALLARATRRPPNAVPSLGPCLVPDAPVFAAFDPDPDGIHIAVLLQYDTGAALRSELMSPDLLNLLAGRVLAPADMTCSGHAGVFEPLRAALEALQIRGGEQEGVNPWLLRRARELVGNRG